MRVYIYATDLNVFEERMKYVLRPYNTYFSRSFRSARTFLHKLYAVKPARGLGTRAEIFRLSTRVGGIRVYYSTTNNNVLVKPNENNTKTHTHIIQRANPPPLPQSSPNPPRARITRNVLFDYYEDKAVE